MNKQNYLSPDFKLISCYDNVLLASSALIGGIGGGDLGVQDDL